MNNENKEIKKDKRDSGSDWIWLYLIFSVIFGGNWNHTDCKDHELRERVARLEGQMDMLRR